MTKSAALQHVEQLTRSTAHVQQGGFRPQMRDDKVGVRL
jgi:hypothetical protein